MSESVLMITAIAGAENCAAVLSKQFQMPVETAASRRDGLAALRRREYLIVVVDQSLIEPGEDGADSLFRQSGMAIPLEINFAISGCGRLVREVRAALHRRERERELAARAAASALESELKQTLAGLMLQSQLALAEVAAPSAAASRLNLIIELADTLRLKLEAHAAERHSAVDSYRSRTAAPISSGASRVVSFPAGPSAGQDAPPKASGKPLVTKNQSEGISGRDFTSIL